MSESISGEGDLTKDQVKAAAAQIWDDPAKRDFALVLMSTIAGKRVAGLENDQAQYPMIEDLGLSGLETPTLLVHATTDTDVPPKYSEYAVETIPGAEIMRVENGTHVSVWTDPTSYEIKSRIVTFLRGS